MSRLKHPIRAIREPFGTAGLIVACVALIAALGGTALAAAKLNGTQKKEVEKIAKKFQGTGPAGAAGAAGPAGPTGPAGKGGTNGTNGTDGTDGKSVVTTALAPGGTCAEGGTEFEVQGQGSPEVVCNGEEGSQGPQGPQGPEGALGTAGTTLPTNATETGTWAANPNGLAPFMEAPISFTVQLKNPLGASKVHFLKVEEVEEAVAGKFGGGSGELCEGKTGAQLTQCETEKRTLFTTTCAGSFETPKASSGNLCVYSNGTLVTNFLEVQKLSGDPGASVAGALVVVEPLEPAKGIGVGSWAVTG